MGLSLRLTRSKPLTTSLSLPDLPGLDMGGNIVDRLIASAHVGLAYGQPTVVGKRTIIPIGAVAYGVGGGRGFGRAPVGEDGAESIGGGGGGGGGVRVAPVAFLEVTANGVRVRPVLDWTRIVVALITVVVPLIGVRALKRTREATGSPRT